MDILTSLRNALRYENTSQPTEPTIHTATSAQNTAPFGGAIPEQASSPAAPARRRATAVATLRTKATLENCLAAACDRNNLRAATLRDIEAILVRTQCAAISAEQLRIAIAAQLAKLPPLLADIDEQARRRGDQIDARSYPDELDDEASGANTAELASQAGRGLSVMPAMPDHRAEHPALHAA
mgnify:CR=1 FL=1